jgi:hypothetical protein
MTDAEKLIMWFLSSPIYIDGAYVAFYSSKSSGPPYPEITAYAISLSCILYRQTKEHRFAERAETCAEYLIKISKNGGIPSLSDNLTYAFDTGIFISSMFDLYEITRKKGYVDEAKKSLDWLDSLWNKNLFSAVDKIPEKKDWVHLPSVHLVKLAIPLIKASRLLCDNRYEKTALELLRNFGRLQNQEGAFRVNENSRIIMTHPHCYATEGFLYAYYALKLEEFLETATKASNWLKEIQNPDGSFYRQYTTDGFNDPNSKLKIIGRVKTSDATAQATRIWKLLGTNQDRIMTAYRFLDSQTEKDGLKLFSYRFPVARIISGGHVYSWPTFFYLHSLLLPFGQIEHCRDLF